MEDDYMEMEVPLENLYMDGQFLFKNDDMENDYMDIQIPLENHDMDGQNRLENKYVENDYMEIAFPLEIRAWMAKFCWKRST